MKYVVNEYEWREDGMHRVDSNTCDSTIDAAFIVGHYCEENDLFDIYKDELAALWNDLLRMDRGEICSLQFHAIGRFFSIYTIPDDI